MTADTAREGITVALTGSGGMVGTALSAALRARGDRVVHLVRREPSADVPPGVVERRWDPSVPLPAAALAGVAAVVHLGAQGFGDRRWTQEHKRLLRDARVEGTISVSAGVAGCRPAPRLLSSSGVGYYGDRGEDVLTEDSQAGTGFVAELYRDAEAATWRAEDAGASVTLARSGIVLSPKGGAMGRALPLARFGLTGPLGSGRQFWSWITLDDHVRALLFLLDRPVLRGPVNVTGPDPQPQSDVMKAVGEHLNRPAFLPAPTLALRLALGEMASELVTTSQRALPAVLQDAGFRFDHPDLRSATRWLVEQAGTEGRRAAHLRSGSLTRSSSPRGQDHSEILHP